MGENTNRSYMRAKRRRIHESIYLVEFPTQYQLAATFLRFQEYYESKRFHGRVFSLEEYMDWYAKQYGNFTYYEDWSGFNIPSAVLKPFREGQFDPLLRKERELLDLFADRTDDFYMVGVTGNGGGIDPDTTRHELAHALFNTHDVYRTAVRRKLREYDTSKIKRLLEDHGYWKHVLEDEVHAYLLTNDSTIPAAMRKTFRPLSRELRRLYRRHASEITIQ